MSEATNPHADLIAKLDEDIASIAFTERCISFAENPNVIEHFQSRLAEKKLVRAYVAIPCPDCKEDQGFIYVRGFDKYGTSTGIKQPCPNPRHALIGELRRVMGL